jgi:hypothetical protein
MKSPEPIRRLIATDGDGFCIKDFMMDAMIYRVGKDLPVPFRVLPLFVPRPE